MNNINKIDFTMMYVYLCVSEDIPIAKNSLIFYYERS